MTILEYKFGGETYIGLRDGKVYGVWINIHVFVLFLLWSILLDVLC